MTREININRLRLKVPGVQSASEGRALAKAVSRGLVNSFQGIDVTGCLDAVNVRVAGGRAKAGDVVGAVRSAIAKETSSLRNERRRS
jgi:hypothetical protein